MAKSQYTLSKCVILSIQITIFQKIVNAFSLLFNQQKSKVALVMVQCLCTQSIILNMSESFI